MNQCYLCNSQEDVYIREEYGYHLCSGCYNNRFIHNAHIIKPPEGEIWTDHLGRVICHICGKAFNKLGQHTYNSHKMTAKEYKTKFGLAQNVGLINNSTKKVLQDHIIKNYNEVVVVNLIEHGKDTRFKNGDKGRTKDKISLQTYKALKEGIVKLNTRRKDLDGKK